MSTLSWYIVVTIPLGVLGTVYTALLQCAVSEFCVRLAARIYPDQERQVERREEWVRMVQDMRPAERPAQAASLLWLSTSHQLHEVVVWWARRRGGADAVVDMIADLCDALYLSPFSGARLLWWRAMISVWPDSRHRLAKVLAPMVMYPVDECALLEFIATHPTLADAAQQILDVSDQAGNGERP